MIAAEFSTNEGAIFAATQVDLQKALPGWRVPLPRAEWRPVKNPFTGDLTPCFTRDPGARTKPSYPKILVFDCVVLPSVEHWERHYVALDLALSDVADLPSAASREFDWDELLERCGFCEEPLLGGTDNEIYLWVVPDRLADRLSRLEAKDIPRAAAAWTAFSQESPPVEPEAYLRGLAGLARLASARQQKLFTWNIHPYHRADSGKPARP